MTQQFDDFITKRLHSPEMPDVVFFDQSMDAKLNRSRLKLKKVETPFLQSAKTHKVLKTFTAVGPDTSDLGGASKPFLCAKWPETMNSRHFGVSRPMPSIITAEFDRQAALISRLRSHHSPGTTEESLLMDFYGSDYDILPEGMAFTVFFYAYSAVIGREWQAHRQKQKETEIPFHVHSDAVVTDGIGPDKDVSPSSFEVKSKNSDQILSDMSLGFCDSCPEGGESVNDALVYVADSHCPGKIDDFNAQVACDAISKLTKSPFQFLQGRRSASLLDDNVGFAECEEARDVAAAQLDLAFDTLKTMESRGLMSDPDACNLLMEACGRCGDTKRALELTEIMNRDGLVADKEALSCFMAAFACTEHAGQEAICAGLGTKHRSSDAYSTFLKKKLDFMANDSTVKTLKTRLMSDSEAESNISDVLSSSGSEMSAGGSMLKQQPLGSGIFDWLAPQKSPTTTGKVKKRRRRKRSSNLDAKAPSGGETADAWRELA